MVLAPPLLSEIRLLLVLSAMLLLPGSGLLLASGFWLRWPGLQRVAVVVGLSLAFYPLLFYTVRFVMPAAHLNSAILWLLLTLALIVTLWGLRRQRPFPLHLDWQEWVAVVVIGLTLFSRFWFANVHPFPAWSDSLHHTLLTELTAVNGRLPTTLAPYFPNELDMYHMGLYALSGTAQMLAQVPAHTALLWTAQFLNGLCGLGVYLLVDRYAGRTGAVVAIAVAGLFSAHPALWANWGRFTQLASLVVLPIAWTLMLELLLSRKEADLPPDKSAHRWLLCFATAMSAAVFFYHFRVAIFFALLLGPILLWALWPGHNYLRRSTVLKRAALSAALGLLLILPVLWPAATEYFAGREATVATTANAVSQIFRQNYYIFPLDSIPYLAAPVWLLVVTGLSGLIGLRRRSRLILLNLVWVALLIGLGNLYLLNIPALNVTNLGAILIMLYLPISIIIGTAVVFLQIQLSDNIRKRVTAILLAALLLAALPAAWTRANTVEAYRHFVTADDIAVLNWIDANLPTNAIFAINTYFWFPNFAHGTDAGYWIPYFTGRKIVTSAMLSNGLPPDYRQQTLTRSQAAEALETDITAVTELYELGVHYIYVGARGDFSGPGLPLHTLTTSDAVTLLFRQGGAAVFEIKPPQ